MTGLRVGAAMFALGLVLAACGGTDESLVGSEVSTADASEELNEDTSTSSASASSDMSASPRPSVTATIPSSSVSTTASSTATSVSTEASPDTSAAAEADAASSTTVATTAAPTTTTTALEATATEASTAPTVAPAAKSPDRNLVPQAYEPFATFAEVTLRHPSNRVERIGFHESNHDGARQMVQASTAVNPLVLETRNRGNGSSTAADIVVQPGTEIRSPVTGTVLRAGGYVLYCKHNDDFVVIEPDAHPGWEVKLLHISGVTVSAGDRVEAGITVLAPMATQLPFESQVDEFTAEPSWPHVHIEVVDPSIPDRPSTGGGC